ncbi:MAG: hypothetical protein WA738_21605 [Candidatus Angelobacter sp.]
MFLENVKLEKKNQIAYVTIDDKKEGTTAFLEKRPANFQGR